MGVTSPSHASLISSPTEGVSEVSPDIMLSLVFFQDGMNEATSSPPPPFLLLSPLRFLYLSFVFLLFILLFSFFRLFVLPMAISSSSSSFSFSLSSFFSFSLPFSFYFMSSSLVLFFFLHLSFITCSTCHLLSSQNPLSPSITRVSKLTLNDKEIHTNRYIYHLDIHNYT